MSIAVEHGRFLLTANQQRDIRLDTIVSSRGEKCQDPVFTGRCVPVKKGSPTKSGRLAKKLKRIRLDLGLSQNQILERLGFADILFRSNISQYERGHRVPSPPVLLAYARLAKVDLAVLIDDELDLPVARSVPSKTAGSKRQSRKKKR